MNARGPCGVPPMAALQPQGMAKILKCGDLMPGCSFVAERKDMAEVTAKGAEHAKTAHGMTSIPPDLAAKVQAAI